MLTVLVSHVKINSVIIFKIVFLFKNFQSFYFASNVYVSVSSTSLQHEKPLKNRYSKV